MRSLALFQTFSPVVLSFLSLFLTGCATDKAPRSQSDPAKLTSFWQPELLYILPSPHSRLYVEVDAVEGCQPSDATLHKLRDFLSTYCNKPDGIEIVRGDVIPAVTARGVPLRALADKFINGPPDDNTVSHPAYLYVLYCDPTLCDKPPIKDTAQPVVSLSRSDLEKGATNSPSSAIPTTSHRRPTLRNPHVDSVPYPPVMYIYPRYVAKNLQNEMLIHEAGHELGLAHRTTNAFAFHCLDKKCLMNSTIGYYRVRALFGMDPVNQRQLCPLCIAQLTESAKQLPPANLRFVGAVLVRTETNYHVLCLPGRMEVIAGELTEQDCRAFASAVRGEKIPPENFDLRVTWFVKNEVLNEPVKMGELFDRAKADPLEYVRKTAPNIIFARFYANHGQFTNAINICREAIASSPEKAWSYNLLAWIEATCPESSVRDGNDAVSLATKACELTNWKVSSSIDTLAAAYAESSDFQRAIQFEEQALRTGDSPESRQKARQERLELYKQSQPYRQKAVSN